jgi:hypothetical protein
MMGSSILVTLMMEAMLYSETSVLTRSTQLNITKEGILQLRTFATYPVVA